MRFPRPTHLALRVFQRNLAVWRKHARASAIGNFLDPLLYLVVLGMGLGRVVERRHFGGASYMEFIAPGLITSTAMYSATFECTFGSYTRLATQKTFAALVATPIDVDDVVLGEALFGSFKAALGGGTVLLVAAALGLVSSPFALLAPLAAALVGFLFASAALVVTAVSPSYEFFNYHFTLFITPMFLLSGIFFPVAEMPDAARAVAEALPLTWAVDLVRGLTVGEFRASPWLGLVGLCLAWAAVFVPAAALIRRRLIR